MLEESAARNLPTPPPTAPRRPSGVQEPATGESDEEGFDIDSDDENFEDAVSEEVVNMPPKGPKPGPSTASDNEDDTNEVVVAL